MTEITPEMMAAARSRDGRVRFIGEVFALEGELRDNRTSRAILAFIQRDAEDAMEEIADTSPADTVAVMKIFSRVRAHVFLRRSLMELIHRGETLAREVSEEDSYRE